MRILAIETSCDETAAAVVEDGVKVLSNVVASSAAMHEKYGGIVPEVAAREQLKCIIPVLTESLESGSQTPLASIDAVAVTVGPGLIGSLLVGVETAKSIAFVIGKPIIPVNHVIAHMYANFIESGSGLKIKKGQTPQFPAISLVVSGGHTELYLMKSIKDLQWLGGTLDDAAGEAFDKTARLLGFGNGGGVAIQEAAAIYSSSEEALRLDREGSRLRSNTIHLPRPMLDNKSLNFSFSGLKTAILREVNKLKTNQQFNNATIQQLAYEVQEAITDVLVAKTLKAAQMYKAKPILLSGGVAANLRLREKFLKAISYQLSAVSFFAPSKELCTDNAAYIAAYAYFRGHPIDWHKVTALPDLSVEEV